MTFGNVKFGDGLRAQRLRGNGRAEGLRAIAKKNLAALRAHRGIPAMKLEHMGRACAGLTAEFREAVPADVLLDRDRRMMLAPRSLTALICGDPEPGRSALDRR